MTTIRSDDEVSLLAARQRIDDALREGERTTCPCCRQVVKRYRRALHAAMAQQLVRLFYLGSAFDREWVQVKRLYLPGSSGDYAKLRFWGLIEPYDQRTADSNAAGYWRVTKHGVDFVLGQIVVPRYVYLYNNEKVGEDYTETLSIWQALGAHFDYADLMAGGDGVKGESPTTWHDEGEGEEPQGWAEE